MPEQRFIGYCRSSTPDQVHGLAIQRQRIASYAARVRGELLACYAEMRPASPLAAKVAKRQPELCLALDHCRRVGATLLVARLDRLTRSAAFFTSLLEAGPPVVIAELPNASRFVLHVYAAVAEEYIARVGRRIRASKARARAEGRKTNPHAKQNAKRQRAEARARARVICTRIEALRRGRAMAASDVARELNRLGLRTHEGALWAPGTVYTVWHQCHRKWRSVRFRSRPSVPVGAGEPARRQRAEALRARIAAYHSNGARSAWEIRDRLNADHIPTATGLRWSLGTTHRLLQTLRRAAGG
jgi:DNA invertase Pin-like site-specific DNA recombinase